MANHPHLASVLKSGHEAQSRRKSVTVAPDEIAPDEYPTFTRPVSPELAESKRYTHEPPKRKRTNPWVFNINSNSFEGGDDCDRPLSRKLSRKASNVFNIFTPQRTRSNASAAPAQRIPEAPEFRDTEEHVQPAAERSHVTGERRKSSLKQLMDYLMGKRKDSASSEKSHLPAPPLDEDDAAMGLRQRPSPTHPQSLATLDADDAICMTGALPANPNSKPQNDSGSNSFEPLVNPNLTESKRRKASTAAASVNFEDPSMYRDIGSTITGYSPPPTPRTKRSILYPKTAMSNYRPSHSTLRRLGSVSSRVKAKYIDITVTGTSARHAVAPWEEVKEVKEAEHVSPSTSTIGILPSPSSVESISQVSLPTFALPPHTTANASTLALYMPSRPHSPAQAPSETMTIDVSPSSPSTDPTEVSGGQPETLDLASLGAASPKADLSSRTSVSHSALLEVPDVDTRPPSTAADSLEDGDLRLRRFGSLRREAWRLEGMEGMEGFEFVERAIGWGSGEGRGRARERRKR